MAFFEGLRGLAGAAVVLGLLAGTAEAATYTLDTSASTITVTPGPGVGNATLAAAFGAGATGFSWTPGAPSDTTRVEDFFAWSVSGYGYEKFSVDVALRFTSPDAGSSVGGGNGVFGTLNGVFSGGWLRWGSVSPITFSDGSTLAIDFDDVYRIGSGAKAKSGASFTATEAAPQPVPVPASLPLIAAGLLSLGALARRKRDGASRA